VNGTYVCMYLCKGLSARKPKMDYDQTAMGLPPVTSTVFLIAKSFCLNIGEISEMSLPYC
jgi:hypothetical protein